MKDIIFLDQSLIFFGLYVIFIALLYMGQDKKKILICNFFACSFAGIYLLYAGGLAGVVACAAAALGSLFQLSVDRFAVGQPQIRFMVIKCFGCILFALIGILAVYNHVSDLYLVVAIISCRCSEMVKNQEHLRMGYLFAEVLWLHYAIVNGLVLFATIHAAMAFFGMSVMIWQHYKTNISAALRKMRKLELLTKTRSDLV